MKKAIALPILGLAALLLLASDDVRPLNVKPGLWQMTQTIKWTGLPDQYASVMPNPQTTTYKSCVRAKDLNGNPWADGSGDNCVWTVLKSTGTDMEVRGKSCSMGSEWGMTSEIHGTIHVVDSENGTGSMEIALAGNGQNVNGHAAYVGKWVAPSCPASME